MHNAHRNRVRDALWQLTAVNATPDALTARPPLFLRTPSIVLLWVATLSALVGLLAVSRLRLPNRDRDRSATSESTRDSVSRALLFLAPRPSARGH